MSGFEIVTAVLAGGRHFELRVFYTGQVTVAREQLLTERLCCLMDKQEDKLQKYDIHYNPSIPYRIQCTWHIFSLHKHPRLDEAVKKIISETQYAN